MRNMKMLKDNRAENPLDVGFYVLIVLLVMSFLMITVGAFLDEFEYTINNLPITATLSSWGDGVLSTYLGYIDWAYSVPAIFIIIVMIWGVITVIRKHTYTSAQEQQYLNTEEY